MVRSALRALWAEPRPPHPPVRVWRDWALVAVLVSWSVIETMVRHDLAWRQVVLTVAARTGAQVTHTEDVAEGLAGVDFVHRQRSSERYSA